MEGKIRVVQHGVGAKGKIMVKLMLNKIGIEIVGAVDVENVGKDLGEVVGLDKQIGITISDSLDTVLAQTKPDVMLDATLPYMKQLYPIFMKALEARVHIISIAPQALNPWVNEPELAKSLDKAARINGVAVVGTGTDPGLCYDVLPAFFTRICGDVRKITCYRVGDTSKAGPSFRRRVGFGLSKNEAERKLATGEVQLSVARRDEVYFLANCLGWKLSEVKEETEFLVSKIVRDHLPSYRIEPGQVWGFRHDCYGIRNEETVIEIKSVLAIDPLLDGLKTCYTISIEGDPSFKVDIPGLSVSENIPMVVAAQAVNWIPYIMKVKPGLLTDARDFPLLSCMPSKE